MNRTIKIYIEGTAEEITDFYNSVKSFAYESNQASQIEEIDIE